MDCLATNIIDHYTIQLRHSLLTTIIKNILYLSSCQQSRDIKRYFNWEDGRQETHIVSPLPDREGDHTDQD
jgi:hypothetical protein